MSTSLPRINVHDHGGKLVLCAALMLAYTFILVIIRLYSRWPWRSSFKGEDGLLLGATVRITVALLWVGFDEIIHPGGGPWIHCSGLHRPTSWLWSVDQIPLDEQQTIKKALLVSFVFLFLAEGLAIVSYGMFIGGLSQDRKHRLASKTVYGVAATWSLAGMTASVVATVEMDSLSVMQDTTA
ncbi:hypothetical protein LTS10_013276 [Elasticomyces elasticus]|nr:hypothetical protein LTS10_013276 [Elasticomyces elasticus]